MLSTSRKGWAGCLNKQDNEIWEGAEEVCYLTLQECIFLAERRGMGLTGSSCFIPSTYNLSWAMDGGREALDNHHGYKRIPLL